MADCLAFLAADRWEPKNDLRRSPFAGDVAGVTDGPYAGSRHAGKAVVKVARPSDGRPTIKALYQRATRSLGAKLFLGMLVLSPGLLLGLTYLAVQRTTALWTRSFEEQTAENGALIERALRYAMLSNRKDDLHAALRDIAKEQTLDSLRIYDKNGRIKFSTNASEVGGRVRRDDDPCVGCHRSSETELGRVGFSRILQNQRGQEVLARFQPIMNENQCSTARCHAHSPERSVLGVLDLRTSAAPIRESQAKARSLVLWAGLLAAGLSAVGSALFIQRFVSLPVRKLRTATERVAAGDLTSRIRVDDPGELQDLANAFNGMIEELGRARQRSERWEEELTRAVEEKTESLSRAQRQLANMEKLASLGKLSATVAHELNNPLGGILVYAKLVHRELANGELTPETREELLRYLSVIAQESSRCGEIVKNLLTFARQSRTSLAERHLLPIVEQSLLTLRHLFQQSKVACHTELQPDDALVCDHDQIQQALVALLVNAVEAMPSGGSIEIRSFGDADHLQLEIEDTGSGISAEILPSIFEPFFSTKGEEKGVGLGLSVVYGIVKRHAGTIEVESKPEQGALFRIVLPRSGPPPADAG